MVNRTEFPCSDKMLGEKYRELGSSRKLCKWLIDEYGFYTTPFTVIAKLREIGVEILGRGGNNNVLGRAKYMRVPNISKSRLFDAKEFAQIVGMSKYWVQKRSLDELPCDSRDKSSGKKLWKGETIISYVKQKNNELKERLDERDNKRNCSYNS